MLALGLVWQLARWPSRAAHAGSRSVRFAVPAPTQNYALAQIDVRAPAAMRYDLRVQGPHGADYIAAAAVRSSARA